MKIDISLLLLLSITVCSIVIAADDPTKILENVLNKMGVQDGGQCEFLCPKDGKKTRDPEHTPSSDGCGAHGVKIDVSRFPGFEQCCDTHDSCYDTCSSVRKQCDDDFNKCLKGKCEQIIHDAPLGKRDQMKEPCRQMNHILYSGASLTGCSTYQMAQSNACLCDGEKVDLKKSGQYQFDSKTLSYINIDKSSVEGSKKSSEEESDKSSEEESDKSSKKESDKSSKKESDKSSKKESDKSSKKESDKSSKKENNKSSNKESDKSPKKESKKSGEGKKSSKNGKTHQTEKEQMEVMEKLKAMKQQEYKDLEEALKDEDWVKDFDKYLDELEDDDIEKEEKQEKESKKEQKRPEQKTTKTSEKKDSDKIKEKDENKKETVIESRTLSPREEL